MSLRLKITYKPFTLNVVVLSVVAPLSNNCFKYFCISVSFYITFGLFDFCKIFALFSDFYQF